MYLFKVLFGVLASILLITLLAAVSPEVAQSTGVPHPDYKGMLIAPNNIDQESHTRWLGYLYGLLIILLFATFLLIGNRRQGKVTSMGKWIYMAMGLYIVVYTIMVMSHWSYSDHNGGPFVLFMPEPTAWMIYGVWFVPLILTGAYVAKFEEAIISDEEIEEFNRYVNSLEGKSK